METKPCIWVLILSFLSLMIHQITKLVLQTTPAPLPPGPKGWPVIGCLPQMIKNRPVSRWIHSLMQQQNTEMACIRLGRTHVISVTSPELACEFLSKQDELFSSRPDCMSGKLLSANYLTTAVTPAGPQWKKMRKIVSMYVLSPSMHKFLHAKRCDETDHLVRYILNRCDHGGLVDVRSTTRHYCSNMMRKLIFGKRFFGHGAKDGGPGNEEIEHVAGIFSVLPYLYGFGIADYAPWLGVFDFDGHKRLVNAGINSVNKYHDPEIVERVEMWRQGIRTKEDDILDVLINLSDSKTNNPLLSIHEIKAQITELMIAAVDIPSNAVEWAIAEMITQPHMLDRACQELDRVVGRNRLVQESDLPKLNYIKSCVKESFRLHPISGFNIPHVSTRDTVVGGYLIPKGSQVFLSRLGLGRNPRVWKDPHEYKPERHMFEDEDKEVVLVDHKLHMISFSTGRQGCPGVMLGSTMVVMLLAQLLQGFSWAEPPDGIHLAQSENNMLMVKPLVASVRPRLQPEVYQQIVGMNVTS